MSTMILSRSASPSNGFESEPEGGSKTPVARTSRSSSLFQAPVIDKYKNVSFGPSRSKIKKQPVQSISAVLGEAGAHLHEGLSNPIRPSFMRTPRFSSFSAKHAEQEDEFQKLQRLLEAYESACANLDFATLLSLPPPADADDIWSEVEDVAVRNEQWDCLLQLMHNFGKQFTTDFIADVITSEYEDHQKGGVISLALHHGWDIDSAKSDGGHILNDALDSESDHILAYLLHCAADPNLGFQDLTLDSINPYLTSTGLALQDALMYGTVSQIRTLLLAGACPSLCSGIHCAVRSDSDENHKIQLLLEFGADKEAREWEGNAGMKQLLDQANLRRAKPLEMAYVLRKAHVVRFLLDPCADPGEVPTNSAQGQDKQLGMPGRRGNGKERRQRTRMRDRKGKVEVLGKGFIVQRGSNCGASDGADSGDGKENLSNAEQSILKREMSRKAKT